MNGWRARLGFLIPPGNPTIEPEISEMAPRGVSVHLSAIGNPCAGRQVTTDKKNATVPRSRTSAKLRSFLLWPSPMSSCLRTLQPAIRWAVTLRPSS